MELPTELLTEIENLLEKKKITQEKDLNPQLPVLQEFIQKELERQKLLTASMTDDRSNDWNTLNELFFRSLKT